MSRSPEAELGWYCKHKSVRTPNWERFNKYWKARDRFLWDTKVKAFRGSRSVEEPDRDDRIDWLLEITEGSEP